MQCFALIFPYLLVSIIAFFWIRNERKVQQQEQLEEIKPEYIIVFPWNILGEIKNKLKNYKLITAIPSVKNHF